jgi:hypothetical protein
MEKMRRVPNDRPTFVSARFVPLDKDVRVVEQLRHDKVSSSSLLLEQEVHIGLLVVRIGVTFGVACAGTRDQ